jgi:hypothetical protein
MFSSNPVQIQWRGSSGQGIPLFLIHDGGGTIFNYFLVGDLQRDVYGVYDEYFETETSWSSMRAMAQQYVSRIKSIITDGPVLIGGNVTTSLLSMPVPNVTRLVSRWICISGDILYLAG